MIEWDAHRIAAATGARLLAGPAAVDRMRSSPPARGRPTDGRESDGVGAADRESASEGGPSRVVIDSREARVGDLFVGLRGVRADGGDHAGEAIAAGAWGVLLATRAAERLVTEGKRGTAVGGAGGELSRDGEQAFVLAHDDPLAALAALAREWRVWLGSEHGTRVVAVTGSVGKTSTKDILGAMLTGAGLATVVSPQNLNTEIGMPLSLLSAPAGTDVIVVEMGMRGAGQIAQLTAIAAPDVGVIVNIGPVHLELLGSMAAIAAAKAELIDGLGEGTVAVVPAGEQLLTGHLDRRDLRIVAFGPGGEVRLEEHDVVDGTVVIREGDLEMRLAPSFSQAHNLSNLVAAVAAARALGVTPGGALEVAFSALRGARVELGRGAVLVNDCYNANPVSMRAAIDDLMATAPARRVAVLGEMLELGPTAAARHREVGRYAAARGGVEVLIAVGGLGPELVAGFEEAGGDSGQAQVASDADDAAARLGRVLAPRDTVLVKGSRGVGLERVAEILTGRSLRGSPRLAGAVDQRAQTPAAGGES